jgi:formate hydrogenlyase subunit 4
MNALLGLILAPLLVGVINRTKAFFAGRTGPPLLQPYLDLWKLLHKGAVYSRTTTWVFRSGPLVGLAAVLMAAALVPFGGGPALLAFPGDLVLFAYLLGLARFVTVLSALDTGSAFEGMGASREVTFAALAEPALLLGLASIARETGNLSLSAMFGALTFSSWAAAAAPLALVVVALFAVFLAENARIPIDDPNTHLELTMIHEVMVLDHGGPDLAFIQYGAALKQWVLGALLIGIAVPARGHHPWADIGIAVAGMMAMAVAVGVVESCMARLKLIAVPHFLLGAVGLSLVALLLAVQS